MYICKLEFSVARPPIEIFINDKSHKVDPAFTIWQACYEAGYFTFEILNILYYFKLINSVVIPRFCYHER